MSVFEFFIRPKPCFSELSELDYLYERDHLANTHSKNIVKYPTNLPFPCAFLVSMEQFVINFPPIAYMKLFYALTSISLSHISVWLSLRLITYD